MRTRKRPLCGFGSAQGQHFRIVDVEFERSGPPGFRIRDAESGHVSEFCPD
jgi:hypothetical protein